MTKKQKKIIILTAILLIAIFIILAFFLKFKSKDINTDIVLNGNIPNMSEKELKEALKKKQDLATFDVQVVAGGTINVNSNDLTLTVSNPSSNICNCYYEILDREDVIYTSPIMQPQTFMQKQKINKTFKKGNYILDVKYTFLHEENPISTINVGVNILCK